MIHEHMKRYSTPLVIKEMQSKTTMKYFIFTKEDSDTQRKQKRTRVGEEAEKQGPGHCWREGRQQRPLCTGLAGPQKVKHKITT